MLNQKGWILIRFNTIKSSSNPPRAPKYARQNKTRRHLCGTGVYRA